ncbi:MAG: dienelactone hydrolase family protein [Planctomycetes bacterium]|nr:dienelactone hydrolase family protein [Planctomycetota bacterium]
MRRLVATGRVARATRACGALALLAACATCGDGASGAPPADVGSSAPASGTAPASDGAPAPASDAFAPPGGPRTAPTWDAPERGDDATLRDLLSRPAPAFAWDGDAQPVRGLFLAGERYEGRPTRAFALYATPGSLAGVPDAPGSLPAVLLLHGGGGRAEPAWVEQWAARGYAALAPDLAGRGPDDERLPDGGPDQTPLDRFGRLDRPVTEHWHWHACANALAALAWLRERPEVDPARCAVVGISWGGALACVVAGLDERLGAAVTIYGCGLLPEGGFLEHTFALLPPDWTARWTALYDPSRFLPSMRAPLLFVDGTNDPIFPLDIVLRSRALAPDAALLLVPGLEHGHVQARALEDVPRFVDAALRGAPRLPRVSAPYALADGTRVVDVRADERAPPASAEVVESIGDVPLAERVWTCGDATLVPSGAGTWRVRADPAAPDVELWFVTVVDDDGGRASSGLGGPAVAALLGDG